jgi:hypothetical protein
VPNNQEPDEAWKVALTALVVVVGVILAGIFYEPPPSKPKPGPTWQGAGEVVGEKTTKFSKGFVRGAWDTITGKRK